MTSFAQRDGIKYHLDASGITIDTFYVMYDLPEATDKILIDIGSSYGLNDLGVFDDFLPLNDKKSGIVKLTAPIISSGIYYARYICKFFLPIPNVETKVKYISIRIIKGNKEVARIEIRI
jgi:hypothetical protein